MATKTALLNLKTGRIIKAINANIPFSEKVSEDFVIVCNDNGKFAYMDKDLNLITDYIFDDAVAFSEGLANVQIGESWGYINTKGKLTIDLQFTWCTPFYNGLANVENDKTEKAGVINKNGEYIFSPHDYIGKISDGMICTVNKEDMIVHYYDTDGKKVFSLDKRFIPEVNDSEQIALFYDSSQLLIGEDNTYSLDIERKFNSFLFYNDLTRKSDLGNFHDGLAAIAEKTADGWKIGYIDKSGNIVINPQFDYATHFHNGVALFSNGKNIFECQSGLLYKDGSQKIIGDCHFNWSDLEISDYFVIRQNNRYGKPNINGLYGIVNCDGIITAPMQYDTCCSVFGADLFIITKNQDIKRGLVNSSGKELAEMKYQNIGSFDKGYLELYFDENKVNLINENGKIILQGQNTFEVISEKHILSRYDKYKSQLIDFSGKLLSEVFIHRQHGTVNSHLLCSICDAKDDDFVVGISRSHKILYTNYPDNELRLACHDDEEEYFYLDKEGNVVISDCSNNCKPFINGIAWYSTYDGIPYETLDDYFAFTNHSGQPSATNGTTSFFIDEKGDILDVPIDKQKEYFAIYYQSKQKKK